jgi:Ras-related protein Rab-2A
MEDARQNGNPEMSIVLCANKTDLEDKRVITAEEGQEFATRHNLIYVETSAKSGAGVDDAFNKTSESILDKIQAGLDIQDDSHGIKIGKKSHT